MGYHTGFSENVQYIYMRIRLLERYMTHARVFKDFVDRCVSNNLTPAKIWVCIKIGRPPKAAWKKED